MSNWFSLASALIGLALALGGAFNSPAGTVATFLAFTGFSAGFLVVGFRRGEMEVPGSGSIRGKRATEPFAFWVCATFHASFFAIMAFAAVWSVIRWP